MTLTGFTVLFFFFFSILDFFFLRLFLVISNNRGDAIFWIIVGQKKRCTSQEVCVDVAYLCAHKSTTIMIDMLEDDVALETQKYKMPCIHWQTEKQCMLHLFILCARA